MRHWKHGLAYHMFKGESMCSKLYFRSSVHPQHFPLWLLSCFLFDMVLWFPCDTKSNGSETGRNLFFQSSQHFFYHILIKMVLLRFVCVPLPHCSGSLYTFGKPNELELTPCLCNEYQCSVTQISFWSNLCLDNGLFCCNILLQTPP